MQVAGFIFLDRKWETDKVILTQMINYYASLDYKTQLMVFPEGTDLTEHTRKRSDEFAAKNNLPTYKHVLHPRTTGLTYIVSHMRRLHHLDALYDVTVGYPLNFPQRETDLLSGNFPKEVHFHVRRHCVSALPLTEDGLAAWCRARWTEKEGLLSHFHQHKAFPGSSEAPPPGPAPAPEFWTLRFAMLYWTLFIVAILVMLYSSWIARYFVLLQICFYVYMGHVRGGFELFQAQYGRPR